MAAMAGKGEVLREAGLPERDDLARAAEDGLGSPDGEDLIAAPETVAPEAADALHAARLRPRLAGHGVHQGEGAQKFDPAVDGQPELRRRAIAAKPTPICSACSAASA